MSTHRHVLSHPLILIIVKCDIENGGCSQLCDVTATGDIECSCAFGDVLTDLNDCAGKHGKTTLI